MPTSTLAFKSAAQLVRGYKAHRFTPLDVLAAVLARVDECEPQVNAWRLVDRRRARRVAQASTRRWADGHPCGLLDGVPVAIKDVTETRGWPTLNGSLAIDPKGPWPVDAIVVERLKAHGAVILGKTQTPEFAWRGITESALHGVTRNPWNLDWTTGGSSGGAAAAVATGMATLATGTDSGGSIRGPASFCSVVGFKPSFGRVPVWPASPLMMMEHCGPLARTVQDAALAFTVMAGGDPRDGYAIQALFPDVLSGLGKGVRGLKIGISPDLGVPRIDDEVRRVIATSRKIFTGLGARVFAVDLDLGAAREVANRICGPMAARIQRNLGRQKSRLTNDELIASAAVGKKMSAVDFLDAEAERIRFRSLMAAFHETYDLLITPTLSCAPFTVGYDQPPGWCASDGEFMSTTTPFDLTGQPAISVPCGFTPRGGPVGLQIVGPYGSDALVLRAARAFERAQPIGRKHPFI